MLISTWDLETQPSGATHNRLYITTSCVHNTYCITIPKHIPFKIPKITKSGTHVLKSAYPECRMSVAVIQLMYWGL